MVCAALITVSRYGRNIPLAEDWSLIAPLTGHEQQLAGWLWEQNNEHRTPVPRLILLGLLKLTRDFRAGMYLSVILLAVLSVCLIGVSRYLRHGQTRLSDAFFPIVLLHLGHWENLVFNWQVHFVLPTFLICGVLLVMVCEPTLSDARAAVFAGMALISLSLCGAVGLLFVPLLSLWFGYCGVLQLHRVETDGRGRWIGGFLIGAVIVTLLIGGIYFIGYERPAWNPPSPSVAATLKTAAKFIAFGFGPSVARAWGASVIVALGALLISVFLVGVTLFRVHGLEKHRALGLSVFFAALFLYAGAMGWGRAGLIPSLGGLPPRYAHLAVPFFLIAYFSWELYASTLLRGAFQNGILAIVLLLLPFNIMIGFQEWGKWYRHGMRALEQDLIANTSYDTFVERNRHFLPHWWRDDEIVEGMQRLEHAGIGIFGQRYGANQARVP